MNRGLCGDIRIARRYEKLVQDMANAGTVVAEKFARTRAELMGAHRFLGSSGVTPEGNFGEAVRRTARACKGRRVVVAQDTTEVNFAGRDRGRRGLGPAGNGESLGFFAHALVAIDAEDEAVLGVVGAEIWTRSPTKIAANRQKRHIEDKESKRWIAAAETAATVLAEAGGIIMVGDRENDIYQAFTRRPKGVDVITRARGDRKLADQSALFATADAFAPACEIEVTVAPSQPRPLGAKGRKARLAVSFGKVCIARHKNARGEDPKTCDLHVVVAREIDPPAGVEPVRWRLLTTLPVESVEDALEIIRLYRLRWRIEEVFRVLKRDGLALESTQIETASRLFNLAALALIAAARILQLTDARDGSPRPATDIIDEGEIEAVTAIGKSLEGKTQRQQNPHAVGSLAWLAWVVARLGGWNCYYRRPGPKTMADGHGPESRLTSFMRVGGRGADSSGPSWRVCDGSLRWPCGRRWRWTC
jgi:hypothetical protein